MELGLGKPTEVPKLKPVEVPRPVLDIIFVSMVLEEEHLVTPERRGGFRAGDEMTDEPLVTAVLGRSVKTEDLEHDSVGWNEA